MWRLLITKLAGKLASIDHTSIITQSNVHDLVELLQQFLGG